MVCAPDPLAPQEGKPKESIPNWKTPEILAAVYTVMAANREKPEATLVDRAQFAAECYGKFCSDMVEKGVWEPGKNGLPSVEDSVRWRTAFTLTWKCKGQSAIFAKVKDMKTAVANDILPLLRQYCPDGRTPRSGLQWEEVLRRLKEDYWAQWSEKKKSKKGTPMPAAWSEPAWDCFVMFGPRGRAFPEFCPGGVQQFGNDINTSRQTARERDAQRKKAKREEERASMKENMSTTTPARSATATALEHHTRMWGLKLLLQYGSEESKARALAAMEREVMASLDNKQSHDPAQSTTPLSKQSCGEDGGNTTPPSNVWNRPF